MDEILKKQLEELNQKIDSYDKQKNKADVDGTVNHNLNIGFALTDMQKKKAQNFILK